MGHNSVEGRQNWPELLQEWARWVRISLVRLERIQEQLGLVWNPLGKDDLVRILSRARGMGQNFFKSRILRDLVRIPLGMGEVGENSFGNGRDRYWEFLWEWKRLVRLPFGNRKDWWESLWQWERLVRLPLGTGETGQIFFGNGRDYGEFLQKLVRLVNWWIAKHTPLSHGSCLDLSHI